MRYALALFFLVAAGTCLYFGNHALEWVMQGPDRIPAPRSPEAAAFYAQLPLGRYRDLATGGLAPAFFLHAGAAAIALILAPVQLVLGVLGVHRPVHRVLGAIYAVCATVASLTGLLMAPGAYGGAIATAGFVAFGALWLFTTGRGLAAVLRGEVEDHRLWMARSLALCFGGATIRIWALVLLALELPPEAAYGFATWWGWVANLAVVEIWHRGNQEPTTSAWQHGRNPVAASPRRSVR